MDSAQPDAVLIDAMVAALPLPAVFVGGGDRIIAANAGAEAVLGAGLRGRHYITAMRQPDVLAAVERCRRDRTSTTARYLGREGGRDTVFDLHCAFVEAGAAQGVLVTLSDVTDAEQTTQMRRDFVANVSHELRTPLTAVMGFIETLQGPARDDAAAQERFLGIMARETARMNRLVGDLLSLNRVESIARQRPTERVAIGDLLASVVHTLSSLAGEAGAHLVYAPDAQTEGLELAADADQLRQVFTNLIENAIKYGGADTQVTVTLAPPAFEPLLRGQGCRISVRDTGSGIDPAHIPRLTERFYRVDSHRSREMGGTGLGLAIVKHIIERHRGRLEVASRLGEGTVFTVILPA